MKLLSKMFFIGVIVLYGIHISPMGGIRTHNGIGGIRTHTRGASYKEFLQLTQDEYKNHPIHLAAFNGNLKQVKQCINADYNIDEAGPLKYLANDTPLSLATEKNNDKTVHCILQYDGNTNQTGGDFQRTALHHISFGKPNPGLTPVSGLPLLKQLIKYSADPKQQDEIPEFPIDTARTGGNDHALEVFEHHLPALANGDKQSIQNVIEKYTKRNERAVLGAMALGQIINKIKYNEHAQAYQLLQSAKQVQNNAKTPTQGHIQLHAEILQKRTNCFIQRLTEKSNNNTITDKETEELKQLHSYNSSLTDFITTFNTQTIRTAMLDAAMERIKDTTLFTPIIQHVHTKYRKDIGQYKNKASGETFLDALAQNNLVGDCIGNIAPDIFKKQGLPSAQKRHKLFTIADKCNNSDFMEGFTLAIIHHKNKLATK